MKYLGKETERQVVTKRIRPIEYMRCDKCKKKILPYSFSNQKNSEYVHVHTWHNDWGNDSVDSHDYHDLCPNCAIKFVSGYISKMDGSEELELSHEYLRANETYDGEVSYWERVKPVEEDSIHDD